MTKALPRPKRGGARNLCDTPAAYRLQAPRRRSPGPFGVAGQRTVHLCGVSAARLPLAPLVLPGDADIPFFGETAPERRTLAVAIQMIRSCRKASATACVRLRLPSFASAFLKWLRTVSTPKPSTLAISRAVLPSEACRSMASSLWVNVDREPTRPISSPVSRSKRAAAAEAAMLNKPRAWSVKRSSSTLGDQKPTTHRPATGHTYPSRMPYLSASSKGHRSIPTGSSIPESSFHVKDTKHLLAVMRPKG